MRLPQSILFIAVVAVLWPTLTAMKVRYACPSQNYCVPYLMCPGENQVHPNANGQPEDITDIMVGMCVWISDLVCNFDESKLTVCVLCCIFLLSVYVREDYQQRGTCLLRHCGTLA